MNSVSNAHENEREKLAGLARRIVALGGLSEAGGDGISLCRTWLWLGDIERARNDAESLLSGTPSPDVMMHALALLARIDGQRGDLDRCLSRTEDAVARFRAAGHTKEAAQVLLDLAESLLVRDHASDVSVAAARLGEARRILSEGSSDGSQSMDRLHFLIAWARGAAGEHDTLLFEPSVERHITPDLAWKIHAVRARLHARRGSELHAQKSAERALEVLEDLAMEIPLGYRAHFWRDPLRREVRALASPQNPRTESSNESLTGDGRWARLLEITKRLAGESDLDRLLERITDSAVELSAAERGFVLLVDETGHLSPVTVRDAKSPDDPHVAFSQSIAEAVLIDGEPIVTVDARADGRLREYLSVHKLMLQSVACLPIRNAAGVVGVLYVEHRVRRDRFSEDDVELMLAFADQAAIAISNARLLRENERKRHELALANEALERSKAEIERLLDVRTAELDETRRELLRTREVLRASHARYGIVGRSGAMRRVISIIERVRDAGVPVIVEGESGTGKELVARAIHESGARKKKPFVAVNCAAIPEALLESELFGHARGAFTGADRDRVGVLAQASEGTLFLDEIGDMPLRMQIDLLRVLQDGRVRPIGGEEEIRVDVRIIAASNKSLRDLVSKGMFREDLFYRLSVVEIKVPPLRERADDIPLLCDHVLSRIAKREGSTQKRLSREALRRLALHSFPGNVRQLEHVLMNACVMVEGGVIEAEDLALVGDESRDSEREGAELDKDLPSLPRSEDEWKEQERQKILEALEQSSWNRVRAAELLGIPRRTFYRRLKEYEIL